MEFLSSFLSILIIFLHLLISSQSQNDSYYYDTCTPYACGNVTVTFPFSSSETFCGHPGFEITCSSSTPILMISGFPYLVNEILRNECLIIVSDTQLNQHLQSDTCDGLRHHFLPAAKYTPFQLPSWGINLNFSLCNQHGELPSNFSQAAVNLSEGCAGNESLYLFPSSSSTYNGDSVLPAPCVHAAHPVLQTNILRANLTRRDIILDVLNGGFPLQWDNFTACWKCEEEGGRCGFNESTGHVTCFCKYGCGQGGYLGTGR